VTVERDIEVVMELAEILAQGRPAEIQENPRVLRCLSEDLSGGARFP
jgi:hypothetical protein